MRNTNPDKSLPKVALILGQESQQKIYPSLVRSALAEICEITIESCPPEEMAEHAAALEHVRFLFSGWGAPRLDSSTLAMMPHLEAVFYGAGTIKSLVTDEFWESNIPVCSAWAANAIPVAEFATAQIILSLKQIWRLPASIRQQRRFAWPDGFDQAGAYGNTVALISLGQIGQRVARRLQSYDLNVLAYDPFCPPELAQELGVELVDLESCFERARVVSLHSPLLPETRGMIDAKLLNRMPTGATLINTARGGVINEADLVTVLRQRDDLTALLDVTEPEPPLPESPLYDLENIYLTPHIAGSVGMECSRMGQMMVDECERWLTGKPLQYQVTREAFQHMA